MDPAIWNFQLNGRIARWTDLNTVRKNTELQKKLIYQQYKNCLKRLLSYMLYSYIE